MMIMYNMIIMYIHTYIYIYIYVHSCKSTIVSWQPGAPGDPEALRRQDPPDRGGARQQTEGP